MSARALTAYGAYVDRLRRAAGLSQEEFARRIGVSRATYNRVIRGRAEFGAETLRAIAGEVGVAVEELARRQVSAGGPDDATEPAAYAAGVASERRVAEPGTRPHAVRVWQREFMLELARAGASDEAIDRAVRLLDSPDALEYCLGRAPAAATTEELLGAMARIADWVRWDLQADGLPIAPARRAEG